MSDPDLWKQLDATISYRFTAGHADDRVDSSRRSTCRGPPATTRSTRGRGARSTRSATSTVPEVPATATADGQYVQIGVEYFVSINGEDIRPEPGAAFGGTFVDYPTNAWRTANCP